MSSAEIINDGASQSIRLPLDVRLEGTEVQVKCVGRSVLLIPKDTDTWGLMLESLDQFTDDFMEDRRQPPDQQRETVFE